MKTGVLAVGFLAAVGAHAQMGFFNPLSASRNGVHLYGVSIYGGYFSGGMPFGVGGLSQASNLTTNNAMGMTGGTMNLGWNRATDRSSLSLTYSPSYVAFPQNTELNTPGHALAFNWNQTNRKWSFNTSVNGLITSLQQSYFASSGLGVAASIPTTFDVLAGAVLGGKFTDAQLSSALTGAAMMGLPENTYLYGQRTLSASATLGVTYAASGRSSFRLSGTATRMQAFNPGEKSQGPTIEPLIPRTTGMDLNFGWGYSLTPRTQIGLGVVAQRVKTHFLDEYITTSSFSVGRTMSPHWFVQGRAGGGYISYSQTVIASPGSVNYTLGGGIGYKVRTHTFLASYDRSIGDMYGLGSESSRSSNAGWNWKPPGSMWSLSADFGYQQLSGSAVVKDFGSWRANGGVARVLNSHLFVSVQYAYFTYPSDAASRRLGQGAQNGVMMTLSWSPSQYR